MGSVKIGSSNSANFHLQDLSGLALLFRPPAWTVSPICKKMQVWHYFFGSFRSPCKIIQLWHYFFPKNNAIPAKSCRFRKKIMPKLNFFTGPEKMTGKVMPYLYFFAGPSVKQNSLICKTHRPLGKCRAWICVDKPPDKFWFHGQQTSRQILIYQSNVCK